MADIDALVAALTLDEKASLTDGADFWSTVAIPRLGIPTVRVTDGPNGARGASFEFERYSINSGHADALRSAHIDVGATRARSCLLGRRAGA